MPGSCSTAARRTRCLRGLRGAAMLPALTTAALLAACGDSPAPAAAMQGPAAAGAAQPAAKVSAAKPATARPSPADCRRAPAAADGPDVLGLRLGMPAPEAQRLVRCHLPEAVVETQKEWFEGLRMHGVKLDAQAFTALTGRTVPCDLASLQSRRRCGPGGRVWEHEAEVIQVATLGLPGEETVMGVWRAQNFEAGQMPALQDMVAALLQKYGEPTLHSVVPNGPVELAWLGAPDGSALGSGSPQARRCRQGLSSTPRGHQSFDSDCGLSIVATVLAARTNPALASHVSVGLTHQRTMYRMGERMQHELDRREAARRQTELERARAAGPAVKL